MVFQCTLVAFDLIPVVCAGLLAFFFYRLWPVSLLLQNYYRCFFMPVLFLVHAFFSTFLFMAIDQFFYYLHGHSFFTIPFLDQLIFFGVLQVVLCIIIRAATPFFSLKTDAVHTIAILALPATITSLAHVCKAFEKAQAEIVVEVPKDLLVIAQTLSEDAQKECMVEVTLSNGITLWGKRYVHILCYPAHRRGYIDPVVLNDTLITVCAVLRKTF